MTDVDIQWLAVLVSTVLTMALGAAWYSPVLFAHRWLTATGRTREQLGEGPGALYALALLNSAVLALAVAVVADWAGAEGLWDGVLVGLLLWSVIAVATLMNGAFSGRPVDLWALDAGYALLSLALTGAIVGLWN